MAHNQLIRDRFGRVYKLHFLTDGPRPKKIEPKIFYDAVVTRRFLMDMKVCESYWRQIAYEVVGSLPYTCNQFNYFDAVGSLFIQGRILLFEINELDSRHHPVENRTFKQPDGKVYQFVSPVEQLINPNKKTKKFATKKDAVVFIKKLSLEEENLSDLAHALNLPIPDNTQSDEQVVLYEFFADAIIDEKILIFVEIPNKPPTPELIFEDVDLQTVPLAPPTETSDESFVFSF